MSRGLGDVYKRQEITGDMEKGSILLLRVHILQMVMGPEDLRIWSKHAIKPE